MENLITKEQMDYFWKKRDFVYYILSILVFLIHISSFAQYPANEGTMALLNVKMSFFFKESITRFAVPLFFILSGITFFRDYNNQKYVAKIKSRFFTLCVPYLIWNTLWMIFDIICSYTFISSFFTGRKLFELTVGNVLKAVFLAECNIPFWFMSYLIVFVLLSPLLDLLAKNKYVGIAAVAFLSVFSIFEIGTLKYDSVAFYLLGAILGKHYFGWIIKKTSKRNGIFSTVFLVVYFAFKNIFPVNEYFGKPFVKIAVFILASYAFWHMLDLFMGNVSCRPLYTRSFAVFVLHVNVSAIICELLYLIFPKNAYFAFPNFVLTLILTLLAINVFCVVGERYLPRVFALLMGKGIQTKTARK